jgi:hypothetical protein
VLRGSLRVCAMFDNVGRSMLKRIGFSDRLKTSWRRRLASATSKDERD